MKTKSLIIASLCSAVFISTAQADQNPTNSTYQYQKNQQDSFKPTPRTIMDDEIAKNVHHVLAGNWLSHGYPDVSFDVNNGAVNLRGVVDTQEEKNKVEQAVKKIDGVKSVKSEINVGLPASKNGKSPSAMNHHKHHNNIVATNAPATNAPAAKAPVAKDSAATDKDRIINSQIRDKISRWNPKGYETFVIATSNGAVIITGNIERVEDIQKISSDIKTIDGVKSINNNLSTKKQY
jgi:osmotically-inducible protein OsmY